MTVLSHVMWGLTDDNDSAEPCDVGLTDDNDSAEPCDVGAN